MGWGEPHKPRAIGEGKDSVMLPYGASKMLRHTDLERALAALWEIRMEAERTTIHDDPGAFVQEIIFLATQGMGERRQEAQYIASELRKL